MTSKIKRAAKPSGEGCAECTAGGGRWLHLRRCATCGHIGCCDTSPGQHASKHAAETGHPIVASFEPGEDWFFDYRTGKAFDGPQLAPPRSHPADQAVPGPAGRVPNDWESQLHVEILTKSENELRVIIHGKFRDRDADESHANLNRKHSPHQSETDLVKNLARRHGSRESAAPGCNPKVGEFDFHGDG